MIYTPAEDSYLLEKEVRKFSKGKKVLDMGSGSGIQAKAAISYGAKQALASDINSESIFHLKSRGIAAVKSNLFSNIHEKFDLIIFNPPYLPEDRKEDKESRQITTAGKNGDEIILRFFKSLKSHLNKNGICLIVLSSLTPKNRIFKLLKAKHLKKSALSKQKLFMEELEVWKIKYIGH